MPSPKSHRREEKIHRGKRAASFHWRGSGAGAGAGMLVRPRTVPDLRLGRGVEAAEGEGEVRVRMAKLLLKVTVERSPGPVPVVMEPESTVGDLIAAVLRQYKKEGRRPVLEVAEAGGFDLHYSQFSLESLDRDEKLITLGSRNFFLFPRKSTPTAESNHDSGSGGFIATSSCSKQAKKANKIVLPWLKFMF